MDNLRLRRLTGQHSADASRTLVGLRDRDLLSMRREGRNFVYELGSRGLMESPSDSAPSSGPTALSPGPSAASSGHMGDRSGPTAEDPRAPREHEWQTLCQIAAPVRGRPRVPPAERAAIVMQLCARTPLTLAELVRLLDIGETQVRRILRMLLADGRIRYLYPDQPSHPRQRYVAAGGAVELTLPL